MEQDITMPEPLWAALRCCEVNCVAACCGLDAFEFEPRYVQDWLHTLDPETVRQIQTQLGAIAQFISDETCIYISRQLNFWGDHQQWRILIDQWSKMLMPQNCAIPILPSRNLAKTLEFYHQLGFERAAEYETYAILCRDGIELHFSLFPEIIPTESYATCYLRVTNVDDWFQIFSYLSLPIEGIPRLGQLEDKPWGMREFYLIDLDGSLIRIGQVIQ